MTADASGNVFWIEHALLPTGWASGVRVQVSTDGLIASIDADAAPQLGDRRLKVVVHGLGNLHSHAFQRGMAGLAETRSRGHGGGTDSFWSWREVMYRFLDQLGPESFQAIAEQAYMEMLEAGFTRVGEFHYLHHSPGGRPYADPGEMSARVAAAAQATGIGLTLLPVFYAHADFGGAPPNPSQCRLIHDVDGFGRLLESASAAIAPLGDAVLGIAPHSLRAVTPEELHTLLSFSRGPVHIHIAEQEREVEACLSWSGLRPVQWLYENVAVDERWCLVHATHVTPAEIATISSSKAVVGLCPITEANLGDGIFPVAEFMRLGGRFGVGSDSNVLIDAAEELRLLEYGQRLVLRARNVLSDQDDESTGQFLFERALFGGAQALGISAGLRVGASADLVELDPTHPALHARHESAWLDGWIFAARQGVIASVWRKGRLVVAEGRHVCRDRIVRRFRDVLKQVLNR